MTAWQSRPITFRFQLSDWVLFTAALPLKVRNISLLDPVAPVEQPVPPSTYLPAGYQGYAIRNLPIVGKHPPLSRMGNYLCYIPLQYPHCYIDLGWSFEQYSNKFSSKTRSTIQRKIRKYKKHCGGILYWRSYVRPEDIPDFLYHARQVSKLTYQERLLDIGLPNTEEFAREAEALAGEDRLRAYILFDGERPVAYLYCPARNGILIYAYLGYDPSYSNLSVGTVLQWLAMEQIFHEAKFRFFDFTEGKSSHKQLFATHQRLCANVFFIKRKPVNLLLIYTHYLMDQFSKWLGATLERYGLKAKIKHFLRRA